jgi:N-methylhydantoinase B
VGRPRKVSVAGAREDYGVLVLDSGEADHEATEKLQTELRASRTGEEPFFDRGPGYALLSGGAAFNEFDVL